MRESLDQQFDADAARKLKFAVRASARQQHDAKERLMRRAAGQTILPSRETVAERATLRAYAVSLSQQTRRLLNFLLLDSTMYERARRLPPFYQYYNVHGRYEFTSVHMSA
jgi:hypothetical protein